MTIQDLIDLLPVQRHLLLAFLVVVPLLAYLLGLGGEARGPLSWRDYTWSLLVYLAAIPGTVALVLVGYVMFFLRQNLLQLNILVYFMPALSMGLTFWLIGRRTDFDRLPGFGRLSGLLLLIALSFGVMLVLYRMRFLVGFFSSLEVLAGLGILAWILFREAGNRLFGGASRSREEI